MDGGCGYRIPYGAAFKTKGMKTFHVYLIIDGTRLRKTVQAERLHEVYQMFTHCTIVDIREIDNNPNTDI